MQNGAAALVGSLPVSYKTKLTLTVDPCYPEELKTYVHTEACTEICVAALFIIAKERGSGHDVLH